MKRTRDDVTLFTPGWHLPRRFRSLMISRQFLYILCGKDPTDRSVYSHFINTALEGAKQNFLLWPPPESRSVQASMLAFKDSPMTVDVRTEYQRNPASQDRTPNLVQTYRLIEEGITIAVTVTPNHAALFRCSLRDIGYSSVRQYERTILERSMLVAKVGKVMQLGRFQE